MAHDGEEGGLGLRGGLSRGQRQVEGAVFLLKLLRVSVNFGLRPFPFGDVDEDADKFLWVAIFLDHLHKIL